MGISLKNVGTELSKYSIAAAEWRIVDKKTGGILWKGPIKDLMFPFKKSESDEIVIKGKIMRGDE